MTTALDKIEVYEASKLAARLSFALRTTLTSRSVVRKRGEQDDSSYHLALGRPKREINCLTGHLRKR